MKILAVLTLGGLAACAVGHTHRPTPSPVWTAHRPDEIAGCRLLGYIDVPFAAGEELQASDTLVARARELRGNALLLLGSERMGALGAAPVQREFGRPAPAVGRVRGAAYDCPDLPPSDGT